MAAVPESSPEGNIGVQSSLKEDSPGIETKASAVLTIPWGEYAVRQAVLYKQTISEAVDSAIEASKSRLSQIISTSSAHFNQTLDLLEDAKTEFSAYENVVFGKVKEGILIGASHPLITSGVATGLALLVLKSPRRFLYYKSLRLFASEESLLAKADAEVKALRQSIENIKAESEKLEKLALHAEGETIRGRKKLKSAGKQIQGVIQSAYKIERQAQGLKDILAELPSREASRFKSQVSSVASEAKKERNILAKEVSKISNYGISV